MDKQLISQSMEQLVDFLIDAIGSGRVGFDDAVKEFVMEKPGEISSALIPYTRALAKLEKDPQLDEARKDARRIELRAFAARLNTPEASTLVEALITSQDQSISLLKTLEGVKRDYQHT